MYVAVNHERRAFMASVDGVAEYAFHAALRPGEDADGWTAADARRVFREAVGADVPIEVLSMGTWLAGHALVAQRLQHGRVFMAGDAAHLFTPTGGLGYNTAVDDAVNLAWKLASVVRGQAPMALLDSYEAERRPLAQRNTGFARRFADSVGLFAAQPELDDDSDRGRAARVKRLENLESLAKSFEGVAKTYAIQAGREVRVVVEHDKVDDLLADKLAKEIAAKIENEMEYPGQIKVTVIREVRKIGYAK